MAAGENDSSDESEDEDECTHKTKISHLAAATAFETDLEYVEQLLNSSSRDISFIRKWLENATTARGKEKQSQLERFFKPRE